MTYLSLEALLPAMDNGTRWQLTSTQIGAVGESVVAVGLMLASGGQLSPFKPLADDDGTDLLVVNKATRRIIPIQVKSRTKFDVASAQTVQFDVRLKTFTEQGDGYLLAALLDNGVLRASWLIPSRELADIARASGDKLVIVASAKPGSKDKWRRFRCEDFAAIARVLLETPDSATAHAPRPHPAR